MWTAIDKEIGLGLAGPNEDGSAAAEIFSYMPNLTEQDPLAPEGSLWSFNYFFYNHKRKKVVFFACTCNRQSMHSLDGEHDMSGADSDGAFDTDNDDEMNFAMD